MKKLRTWFLLIMVTAILVRTVMVFALDLHHHPLHGELQKIAISLVQTGVYGNPYSIPTGPSAHSTPLYTLLVAALYYLFGVGPAGEFAIYMTNILFASLQYALIPVVARAFGLPLRVGVAAGLVGALVPFHYVNEIMMGEAPVFGLVLLALTLYTIRLQRRKSRTIREAIPYGLCWGGGLLLAPVLIPTFVGYTLFCFWRELRAAKIGLLLVTMIAAFMVLVPWGVRNYYRLGSPVLFRSNFGIELRLSYNDKAAVDTNSNFDRGVLDLYHPYFNRGEALRIQQEGEVAYNQGVRKEAITWMRDHPGRFVRLTILRFFYFWFPWTLEPYRSIAFMVLTLLAAAGLCLLVGEYRLEGRLMAILWLSFPLTYYLVEGAVRYRYPLTWTFLLLASLTLFRCWERVRGRTRTSRP